jgi:hypothetical protein
MFNRMSYIGCTGPVVCTVIYTQVYTPRLKKNVSKKTNM